MSDIFPSADGAASAPMPVVSMTQLLKRFFCSIYSEQVKLIKAPTLCSRRLDLSAAHVQEASPNCPGLDSRDHFPQSQSVACLSCGGRWQQALS